MEFESIADELKAMRAELVSMRQDTVVRMAKDKGTVQCGLASMMMELAKQIEYPSVATPLPRKRGGFIRRVFNYLKG